MAPFDLEELMARGTFRPLSELSVTNLPAEDRVILESLPSTDMSAWTNARIEDYKKRINELETYLATLQSLRNHACAPISRLPNEVLMNVFGDFSLKDPCIRRVCRRWRRIVLATPSFWAECLANECFGEDVNDQTFLCAALRHAGSRPFSLHLQYMLPPLWEVLLDQRRRITTLTLDRYNEFPSDFGKFFPFSPIESLRELKLESTYLTPRELVDFLKNCPLLQGLWLGEGACELPDIGTDDQNLDTMKSAICLPHLKELTIGESPFCIALLLDLFNFKELPAQTTVQLFITPFSGEVLEPAFDFKGVFTRSPINRVCVEPFGDSMVAKGYAGSDECLRISTDDGSDFTESITSFAPPASVLILNPWDTNDDKICEELASHWDLPLLNRLEITHTASSDIKAASVNQFLDRHRHRAGELSLAWALPIVPGQEEQICAVAELRELSYLLEDHVDEGDPPSGKPYFANSH